MTVYRNLEAEMARKGWTRADLAEAINVPRSTVTEWLRPGSATKMPLLDALAICDVLAPSMTLQELFETSGDD